MQNLIKGERYLIKHPTGMWEGEADYSGEGLLFLNLKLTMTIYRENRFIVDGVEYFKNNPCDLNGGPERERMGI